MPATHQLLSWLGLLCFVPVLIPMYYQDKLPNGTRYNFTMGLPFSPWLVAHRTVIKEESKEESKTDTSHSIKSSFSISMNQESSVEFISWSSLLVVMGIALRWLGWELSPQDFSGMVVQEGMK